jgi:hypothetical protein
MPPRLGPARVLILAEDPMSAALLGLLLESGTYEPAFALPGAPPEIALKRVRPLHVILLDGALDVARSDLFHTRAARRGVRIVLWATRDRAAEVGRIARARGLRTFTLPIGRDALAALLDASILPDRRNRTADRRTPTVVLAGEGLLFTDRRGRRWYVYDRRAGERRTDAHGAPAADAAAAESFRAFVNEAGEEWRYGFATGEAVEATPAALERQLAGAVRVRARG